ncbi:MAG: twin-arginine translocase TatA/TatE family subunit [Magnetococcus sp. WYHC-3]
MFGLGWAEIIVIVLVALMVIGPDKLPEVARGLARMARQIQRVVGEVRDSVRLDEWEGGPDAPTIHRSAPHLPPPAGPALSRPPQLAALPMVESTVAPPAPASATPADTPPGEAARTTQPAASPPPHRDGELS